MAGLGRLTRTEAVCIVDDYQRRLPAWSGRPRSEHMTRTWSPGRVLTALLLLLTAIAGGTLATTKTAEAGWPEEAKIIGTSLQGREILAWRFGSGSKVVMVVGQIHGNERSGISIAKKIAEGGVRPGYTLWVIDTLNPDGNLRNTRQNAAGVDLNRNFPALWRKQSCPGKYCSGPAAASEPETAAFVKFLEETDPKLVVFYHSVGNVVDAARSGVGSYKAVQDYAKAAGLRATTVSCGPGGCTGNATQQVYLQDRSATGFVVELPCDNNCLRSSTIKRHVNAFWAAAKSA